MRQTDIFWIADLSLELPPQAVVALNDKQPICGNMFKLKNLFVCDKTDTTDFAKMSSPHATAMDHTNVQAASATLSWNECFFLSHPNSIKSYNVKSKAINEPLDKCEPVSHLSASSQQRCQEFVEPFTRCHLSFTPKLTLLVGGHAKNVLPPPMQMCWRQESTSGKTAFPSAQFVSKKCIFTLFAENCIVLKRLHLLPKMPSSQAQSLHKEGTFDAPRCNKTCPRVLQVQFVPVCGSISLSNWGLGSLNPNILPPWFNGLKTRSCFRARVGKFLELSFGTSLIRLFPMETGRPLFTHPD